MDKDRLIDETLEQLDACERGPEGLEWRDRDAAAKILEAFAATLLAPHERKAARLERENERLQQQLNETERLLYEADTRIAHGGKPPTGEGA